MWKFNEATGMWEWIAEENKQQEIYNKVLNSLSPELAPFEAVGLTQDKQKWESENPGLKYEDYFGDKRGQQSVYSSVPTQQNSGDRVEKHEDGFAFGFDVIVLGVIFCFISIMLGTKIIAKK